MPARVDCRPRRRNSNRAAETRSFPGHLKWLRGRECCVARSGECAGRMEAAHVDHAGGKGIALKVADFKAVPLCAAHHAEYHRGAHSFEAAHSIDLVATAAAYAGFSPHRAEWEQAA